MILLYAFGFLSGTVIGSFSGAWASSYLNQRSIWRRSACLECQHPLHWLDLIPVISYFLLRGQCRYCGKKIPKEDLWVEVILGIFTALLFYKFFAGASSVILPLENYYKLAFTLFVFSILSTLSIIDLKIGLLPDKIIFPGIIVSLGYWVIGVLGGLGGVNDFAWALISGAVAALFFALLIIITKGRGMGWGDVKYVFFLGLVLGFPGTATGLFLAFLLGSITSVGLIILGKKRFGATIPFGPFLSLGAVLAILYGIDLLQLYLKALYSY